MPLRSVLSGKSEFFGGWGSDLEGTGCSAIDRGQSDSRKKWRRVSNAHHISPTPEHVCPHMRRSPRGTWLNCTWNDAYGVSRQRKNRHLCPQEEPRLTKTLRHTYPQQSYRKPPQYALSPHTQHTQLNEHKQPSSTSLRMQYGAPRNQWVVAEGVGFERFSGGR